jgi:hypothetical protein
VYQIVDQRVYPSSGTATSKFFYDHRGNQIGSIAPNGEHIERVYDGAKPRDGPLPHGRRGWQRVVEHRQHDQRRGRARG